MNIYGGFLLLQYTHIHISYIIISLFADHDTLTYEQVMCLTHKTILHHIKDSSKQ